MRPDFQVNTLKSEPHMLGELWFAKSAMRLSPALH